MRDGLFSARPDLQGWAPSVGCDPGKRRRAGAGASVFRMRVQMRVRVGVRRAVVRVGVRVRLVLHIDRDETHLAVFDAAHAALRVENLPKAILQLLGVA